MESESKVKIFDYFILLAFLVISILIGVFHGHIIIHSRLY